MESAIVKNIANAKPFILWRYTSHGRIITHIYYMCVTLYNQIQTARYYYKTLTFEHIVEGKK